MEVTDTGIGLPEERDRLTEVEKERAAMSAELRVQVSHVQQTGETLRRETAALVTALRKPQIRGSWGETQLKRVAETQGVRQDEWGGRQHFLRWANPDTWRNWEAAGLAYDTTLAYSEAIGFRTGTCHPYRAFDVRERRPLDLREEPFQVMDVTLLSAMGLSLDAAREAVLEVAAQCRRHRGRLGILWHNNTLLRSAREQQWYASLIEAVA